MSVPKLSRLERVDLRHARRDEAAHFTPWLAQAENLSLLGETLGLHLEFEVTERPVGPFAADILCRDSLSGCWVLLKALLAVFDWYVAEIKAGHGE